MSQKPSPAKPQQPSPPKQQPSPPKQQAPTSPAKPAASTAPAAKGPAPVTPAKPVSPPKGKAPEPAKSKAPQPTKGKAPVPAPEPPKKAPEAPKKNAPVIKASEPVKKNAFDPKNYAKNGVTEQEVSFAKTAFDLFDTDQGGSVDIKELKAAMTSLGFQSKNGAIFQMISDLDSDGNGTIDFQQWLNLLTKKVSDKDSRENLNKIFALYDDERTGFISVKNLRRVAQQLGEAITEQELQELIVRADVDQDGLISEDEFYTILTRKIKD